MKPFETDKDLGRVLALVPYYSHISDPTSGLLDNLVRCKSTVLKLSKVPDVAETRNHLAGAACEYIAKHDEVEVVLWIDADMYADRTVLFRQLNHLAELEEAVWPSGVAVAGMYCRRTEANILTSSRKDDWPCCQTKDETIMVPVYAGLGGFMQDVASFVSNCMHSEKFTSERGQFDVPMVSRAGPRMGKWGKTWGKDDWWYCHGLWEKGIPVYLDTSAPWAHLCESLTLPSGIPDGLLTEDEKSRFTTEGGSSEKTA